MADLKKILTTLKVNRLNEFLPILEKELKNFSDEDIARFLANVLVESANFSSLRESLYYTNPARLNLVYPSVFAIQPKGAGYNANNYLRNSEKLANLVYNSNLFASKKSLGNIETGDGFKFRGAGLMQTTARANFAQLSKITKIDFIKNPELLEKPEFAVKSAVIFYNVNKISSKKTLLEVRKTINGSSLGYDEVLKKYNEIKKLM